MRRLTLSAASLLTLVLSLIILPQPALAKYSGGTGEPNNPYLIGSPNDLNLIGLKPNDWSEHFKMTADINWLEFGGSAAQEIGDYNWSQPWTGVPFSGVFDGDGHKISDWCDSNDMSGCSSLFGRVAGPNAVVKNLRLVDSRTNGPALVKYLSTLTKPNLSFRAQPRNLFK